MPALPIYESAIQPEWIDYNGHLRDAYYGLIFSYAIDALMDRIGVDAAYRERTGGTLYTLEEHVHYLDALKQGDIAEVSARIIDADRKRIHLGLEMRRAGAPGAAAIGEFMLLHVYDLYYKKPTMSARAWWQERDSDMSGKVTLALYSDI